MDFNGLLSMQFMMFFLMALGLYLKKKNIVTEEGKRVLTDLVVDVTLPFNIFKSFQITFNMEILQNCGAVIIIAVLIQIGAYILSRVLYPMYQDRRKKVLQYGTICSNAGILGNPVAESIFGSMGLLYASIYTIPQRIFMWSVGITYFTDAPDKKTMIKKVMTHPCIIAVFGGSFFMITQIQLPQFINKTIATVANANTAVSMILVGTILAGADLKTLVDKGTAYYTAVRLVLIPLIVWICCRAAGVEPVVAGVSTVLAGMPCASVTAILAEKYNADAVFATKCMVLSTLLSMVSVPLWCVVLK